MANMNNNQMNMKYHAYTEGFLSPASLNKYHTLRSFNKILTSIITSQYHDINQTTGRVNFQIPND